MTVRCPTGVLDHELRLWLDSSEPVGHLMLQGFRYDLTGKAWQPVGGPALSLTPEAAAALRAYPCANNAEAAAKRLYWASRPCHTLTSRCRPGSLRQA